MLVGQTRRHFVCDGLALAEVRLGTLGEHFLGDFEEIPGVKVGEILSFENPLV